MPLLSVTRTSHRFDRDGAYELYADDVVVATLRDGQATTVRVPPGEHDPYVQHLFTRSDTYRFFAGDEGVSQFECGTRITGWKIALFPVLVLLRGSAVSLAPVGATRAVRVRSERGVHLRLLRPLLPSRRQLAVNLILAALAVAGLVIATR